MKEISGYLANQFGFSETGRFLLDKLIKPEINRIGIKIYDPFEECEKELDLTRLSKLKKHQDVYSLWEKFGHKITPINNRLMKKTNCMFAILDGGHALDDGVASEIGYFAGIKQGPIFALRTDFRKVESMANTVNWQIVGYIKQSKGKLINNTEEYFSEIQKWYDSLK